MCTCISVKINDFLLTGNYLSIPVGTPLYFEHGKCSNPYHAQIALVNELFSLVPESLRGELLWQGPSIQVQKRSDADAFERR